MDTSEASEFGLEEAEFEFLCGDSSDKGPSLTVLQNCRITLCLLMLLKWKIVVSVGIVYLEGIISGPLSHYPVGQSGKTSLLLLLLERRL